jgi:hypothetical protein
MVLLSTGTNYRLSYAASSTTTGATMSVKVGLAVSPYTTDFVTSPSEALANIGLQTFTHDFTPPQADANAGVAFTFPAVPAGATICIDNVSLTVN